MKFQTALPPVPADARAALYAGVVFLLPPRAESIRLVRRVRRIVRETFADVGPPRRAQHVLEGGAMHARVNVAREALRNDTQARAHFLALMDAIGLSSLEHAIDDIRLRAIQSGGHRIAAAAPIYTPHRDTWYANPRSQINGWLPLHDVDASETFVFYPTAFGVAVENTSVGFDYESWRKTVGFQNPAPPLGAVYPRGVDDPPPFEPVGFSARVGAVLLFAGAHLHQTRRHDSGFTRFSIDVRTVYLTDHQAGLGAPVVDDRSRGSTCRTTARKCASGEPNALCSSDDASRARPRVSRPMGLPETAPRGISRTRNQRNRSAGEQVGAPLVVAHEPAHPVAVCEIVGEGASGRRPPALRGGHVVRDEIRDVAGDANAHRRRVDEGELGRIPAHHQGQVWRHCVHGRCCLERVDRPSHDEPVGGYVAVKGRVRLAVHRYHVLARPSAGPREVDVGVAGHEGIVAPLDLANAEGAAVIAHVVHQPLAQALATCIGHDGDHVGPVDERSIAQTGESQDEAQQRAVRAEGAGR